MAFHCCENSSKLWAMRLLWFASLALVLSNVQPAWAEGNASLAGRWSAGVLNSAWSLSNWGDECGPSPVGGNEAGGIVTITQMGSELSIVGLGRSFSSNSCWDQQPGLAVVAHTAGSSQWTTTCRSAAGDPRRVTIATTLLQRGTTLDLDENGRYEVAIAGKQCSANVRRTRHFVLVHGDHEIANAPSDTPEKVIGACANPGPATRIEASPTYKLLRPGEQFAFRAKLSDEKGCPVSQKVSWRLTKPSGGVHLDSNGKLSVAADAPESEVQLSALFGEQSVQVTVYVVSAQRYAELLASPSFNPAGESDARSIKSFVPKILGTRTAQIDSTARRRRTIFVWSVTVLAALMGLAAAVLARRRRYWVTNREPPERKLNPPAYSKSELPEVAPVRLICPICGEQYDAGSQFCGKDGATLVPLN